MRWLPQGYRAETVLDVKRSRFITTLARVDDEDGARALIAVVRHAYPDARHHCSAFIVESPGALPVERSSDDGEPSGTAGMPMLDVLRGAGVAQAVVVVTRYFGGVLLGAGGLVRAYSDSVTKALASAGRVQPVERDLVRVAVEHADFGRLQAVLLAEGFAVVATDFGAKAQLTLAVPSGVDAASVLARHSGGALRPEPAGTLILEEPV